jgi:hypothetical protein
MPVRPNALDQQIDIKGSINPSNTRTLTDESSSFGATTATGTGDTIGGTAPNMTLTDAGATFTAADVGRFITIAGATTGANNGSFLISAFTSGTVITYQNASGVAEAFTGTYSVRDPYSLEDDINFVRTDRKLIKGTASHTDSVPTYERPTAVGTAVPANLTNIASKTTDAKALVNTRLFLAQAVAHGNTNVTVSSAGNLPWADAVDRTGVPVFDGADAGDHEATYIELINPSTGQALTVDGRAVGRITAVAGAALLDGEVFVLSDGTNPAVTFEFDSNASVVQSNTLRAITFAGGDSAATVAATIIAAVNSAPVLNINASTGGGAIVELLNTNPGTAGNVTITETVVDAGFIVVGMSGGTADAGFRIFARSLGGGAVDGDSYEAHFRKVAQGAALSGSAAYTWEKLLPTSVNVFYGFRERLDLMSENALRRTLVNGIVGDAGVAQDISDIRSLLGVSDGDDFLEGLTNTSNFYVFSGLDQNPSVTEVLNKINQQIGIRDYTGPYLTDGETITASLQALSSAISSASVTRVIERLAAQISAGTAHTLPGGNTYLLDGTNNGVGLWVFWRGLLRDPGPSTSGNDYTETSTTSITAFQKINSGDHINYFIL